MTNTMNQNPELYNMKFTKWLDEYLAEKATLEMLEKDGDYHPAHIFRAVERKENAADKLNKFVESLTLNQD